MDILVLEVGDSGTRAELEIRAHDHLFHATIVTNGDSVLDDLGLQPNQKR